jgi:hypothetical protein
MSEDGWTQVRQKPKASRKPALGEDVPGGPTTPRARTNSAIDVEVLEKGRISKTAHRENKLEWSASKRREREARIERRNVQRDRERAKTTKE